MALPFVPALLFAPLAAPQAPVSLADLARSYVRLEEALAARELGAQERALANERFDAATRRFFAADLRGALRGMDALRCELAAEEGAARAEARLLSSLRCAPAAPVLAGAELAALPYELAPLYGLDLEEELVVEATLVVVDGQGHELAREALELSSDDPPERRGELALAAPLEAPASLSLELRGADGSVHARSRCSLLPETPERIAVRGRTRLAALDDAELASAVAVAMARLALLERIARPEEAALAPLDTVVLAAELEAELEALLARSDPYIGRTGELWRTFGLGERAIRARMFVPALAEDAPPPPLVVALHGAGGNEHLVFEGYGAGLLRREAERRGFVLVAPSTYALASEPARFAELLGELARTTRFDPERVHVLGHSLGALAAARIAALFPERVARAVCLAGGGFQDVDALPPTLVVLAERDTIVPAVPQRAAIEHAIARGLPIELRVLAGEGHTLMFSAALPLALDWLGL